MNDEDDLNDYMAEEHRRVALASDPEMLMEDARLYETESVETESYAASSVYAAFNDAVRRSRIFLLWMMGLFLVVLSAAVIWQEQIRNLLGVVEKAC